jgi:hypothetical protein
MSSCNKGNKSEVPTSSFVNSLPLPLPVLFLKCELALPFELESEETKRSP